MKEINNKSINIVFCNYYKKTITYQSPVFKSIAANEAFGNNKDAYSTFFTSTLSVINCDRFVKQELITFTLPTDNNTLYAIVYQKIKAVSFAPDASALLAKNYDVTVFAINKINNRVAYAKTNTNKGTLSTTEFKACTKDEFNKQVANLNSQ
jgi:hypothetical protein